MSKPSLPFAAILTLAGWLGVPAVSSGAILLFTDKTLFDTASRELSGFTQDFSSVTPGDHLFASFSGGTPEVDYTVLSAGSVYRNTVSTEYGSWLSTTDPTQPLIVGFTSGNAAAVGGTFFLTNDGESPVAGTLDIVVHSVLVDETFDTQTLSLTSAAGGPQPFFGVIATDGDVIGQIDVVPGSEFATFTNLQVAAAVPEAGSVLLGLVAAGLMLSRRRSR